LNKNGIIFFFTGSVSVGQIVYQAAAKQLCSVTLELGGKNPTIVDKDVDVTLAAKRIAWGKFWNAGQTCIAPDYIVIDKSIESSFITAMKNVIQQFYGEDPQKSVSFARIISKQHTQRLSKLFSQGEVVCGGKFDVEDKYISPTVLRNVDLESELMKDEIFGPVLPIIVVDNMDAAIEFVSSRPEPLALYYFGNDPKTQEKILANTKSGGAVVNDVLIHFVNKELPFGGVGYSGVGSYHGHRTFDVFTYERAVVFSTGKKYLDLPLRYPPYTPGVQYVVNMVTRSGW